MSTSRIKTWVLIADSDPAFRRGVEYAAKKSPDLFISSKTAEGIQTVREIRRLYSSVCLVELKFPKANALSLVTSVAREGIAIRIIILAKSVKGRTVKPAITTGSGFPRKREPLEEICKAIQTAYTGMQFLFSGVEIELIKYQYQKSQNSVVADIPQLTQFLYNRKLEVLHYIAREIFIAETARNLHVSATAVKHHRQAIFSKIGIHNDPLRLALLCEKTCYVNFTAFCYISLFQPKVRPKVGLLTFFVSDSVVADLFKTFINYGEYLIYYTYRWREITSLSMFAKIYYKNDMRLYRFHVVAVVAIFKKIQCSMFNALSGRYISGWLIEAVHKYCQCSLLKVKEQRWRKYEGHGISV